MDVPIAGYCDPAFSAVREAFTANFAERGEVGAGVCVLVGGRPVVDLVGGWADAGRTRVWQPDTLVNFYSCGKAIVSLLALQLVDEGRLELTTPLAEVWPEFAAGGKESVTLAEALSHRAAVPALRRRMTDDDLWRWDRMASALAATEPWWEPGTRHAYHTNTFGHLIGETIRRVCGELPGRRLRDSCARTGADVWIGVPEGEQHRCAELIWALPATATAADFSGLTGDALMSALAHFNPPGYSSIGVVNDARWRAAQVPSTNGHGTARGLATMYAAMLDGRLLSPSLLAEATRVHVAGPCPILADHAVFGLGFTPTSAHRPLGPNPRSFGHFGTGGSLGFGDPDTGLAFGYVMNHVIPRWRSSRNSALLQSVYASL